MIFNTSNALERERARAYFDKLVKDGKRVEVTEKKRHRTVSQNALFHLWIRVIADHVGYTDVESCKTDVKRTILGMKESVNKLTGEVQTIDYRTSDMTTKELSDFMDKLKTWALSDMGIYLPYFGDPGYEEMINQYYI